MNDSLPWNTNQMRDVTHEQDKLTRYSGYNTKDTKVKNRVAHFANISPEKI